jgi:hypothetical protein
LAGDLLPNGWMNGISGTRRRRRSKEQVKRLVAEFEASGLERREFRGRHGLALSILQRHLGLFQVALGFIFGSLFERNNRCILSFGASSEYAVLFSSLKGCAFFYPVIHNFRS